MKDQNSFTILGVVIPALPAQQAGCPESELIENQKDSGLSRLRRDRQNDGKLFSTYRKILVLD
jgi:hypothetical protein